MIRNDANIESDPIESVSRPLSEWVVLRHLERDPTLPDRYGPRASEIWRGEVRNRLAQLAQAAQVGRAELFLDSTRWSKVAFASFGAVPADLRTSLECTAEVLCEQLPLAVTKVPVSYIERAIAELDQMPVEPATHLGGDSPLSDLARRFAILMLEHQREMATELVLNAFRDGTTFEQICLEVFQPSLAEIGRLWHLNEISVADEHYCTALVTGLVARLFAEELERRRPVPTGRTALVTSVGGDMHELAPRIVSDFLELAGWRCIFLGANTPAPCIIDTTRSSKVDLVAISVSTNLAVGAVRNAISMLRSDPALQDVKVVVGGTPFTTVPDLWKQIGADAFATNAADAVRVIDGLVPPRA